MVGFEFDEVAKQSRVFVFYVSGLDLKIAIDYYHFVLDFASDVVHHRSVARWTRVS